MSQGLDGIELRGAARGIDTEDDTHAVDNGDRERPPTPARSTWTSRISRARPPEAIRPTTMPMRPPATLRQHRFES